MFKCAHFGPYNKNFKNLNSNAEDSNFLGDQLKTTASFVQRLSSQSMTISK